MEYAGTGWEGTTWKRRPALRTGFGRNLRTAARDADKRAAAMVFVVLFPLVVMLAVLIAASPVAAGSCIADARRPSPSATGIAYCQNPGGHTHYLWVHKKKDTYGWPNKTAGTAGKRSDNGSFSATASGWLGPGWYYTYTGVRWQDTATSASVHLS